MSAAAARKSKASVIGSTVVGEIEIVQIDSLHVDVSYQRDPSMDLVQKMARKWDEITAGPIVVSRRRNGDLYVINGQHRMLAAALAGKTEMVAQVVNNLTARQEAELRLRGNVGLAERSQERFRARVAAGHKDALAIVAICDRFETKINADFQVHEGINAVSAIDALYKEDSGLLLTRVFEVIRDAWGTVGGENATAPILKGLAWFIQKHANESDRGRLIERMQFEGPDGMMRKTRAMRANMAGSVWVNLYRALVEAYNTRLSEGNRLEWKVRGHSIGAMGRNRSDGASGGSA